MHKYEANEGGFADGALAEEITAARAIERMFRTGIAMYTRKQGPRMYGRLLCHKLHGGQWQVESGWQDTAEHGSGRSHALSKRRFQSANYRQKWMLLRWGSLRRSTPRDIGSGPRWSDTKTPDGDDSVAGVAYAIEFSALSLQGITVAAVKSRSSRARLRLRAFLV